jgi:hypothetical protein
MCLCLCLCLCRQSSAARKTVSLHEECSALQKQQEQYSLVAEGLRSHLRYFQAYEELSRLVLGGGIEIGSEEYEKALQSMDESIHYLATNIHLLDARLYLQRLQKLQKKVLGMLRDKVVTRLSELHAQLVKREKGPRNDEGGDGPDAGDDEANTPNVCPLFLLLRPHPVTFVLTICVSVCLCVCLSVCLFVCVRGVRAWWIQSILMWHSEQREKISNDTLKY